MFACVRLTGKKLLRGNRMGNARKPLRSQRMQGLGKTIRLARTLSLPHWGTAQLRALRTATLGGSEPPDFRLQIANCRLGESEARAVGNAKCTTDGSRRI